VAGNFLEGAGPVLVSLDFFQRVVVGQKAVEDRGNRIARFVEAGVDLADRDRVGLVFLRQAVEQCIHLVVGPVRGFERFGMPPEGPGAVKKDLVPALHSRVAGRFGAAQRRSRAPR